MDFSRMVAFDNQGPPPASDVPFFSDYNFSSLFNQSEPSIEPNFDDLENLTDSSGNPYISWIKDFCVDGSYEASPALSVDTPTVTTGMPIIPTGAAAQPDCKLQARVYSPSVAHTEVYRPPPSGKVVELQCDPPDQRAALQNDTAGYKVVPALYASDIAAYPNMRPNVSACDKPPPASHFGLGSYQLSADPFHMYSNGRPAPYSCSFSFPHVEGNQEGKLSCHDIPPDGSQLTSPNYITPLHTSTRMPDRLPMLDVVRSPMANANGALGNIFSPGLAYSQDSPATDVSSASAPAALPTTISWLNRLPESGSFTEPPSPSPSISKTGSIRRRTPYSRASCKGVCIKVKTTILNLHDGYTWKKYGEKVIKGCIFKRSYYKCDEGDRCGCPVLKRIQMCDDGEHTHFTYTGRHNHPR